MGSVSGGIQMWKGVVSGILRSKNGRFFSQNHSRYGFAFGLDDGPAFVDSFSWPEFETFSDILKI